MNTPVPSVAFWKQAFLAHDARCVFCPTSSTIDFTKTLDDYLMSSIDHLVPTALGGANRPDNMVPACIICNFYKKDLVPIDFSSLTETREEDGKRYVRATKVEVYIDKMKVIVAAEKAKQKSEFEEFKKYVTDNA
jgi:hypothetical protein